MGSDGNLQVADANELRTSCDPKTGEYRGDLVEPDLAEIALLYNAFGYLRRGWYDDESYTEDQMKQLTMLD